MQKKPFLLVSILFTTLAFSADFNTTDPKNYGANSISTESKVYGKFAPVANEKMASAYGAGIGTGLRLDSSNKETTPEAIAAKCRERVASMANNIPSLKAFKDIMEGSCIQSATRK